MVCHEHVMQLHRHQTEFEALNTQIILITHSAKFWVAGWRQSTQVDYPLLLDTNKVAYRHYDLGKSWRGVLHPRIVAYYVRHLYFPFFKGNTFQMGGDFIVDTAGVLRYSYRMVEPTDRPSIDTLLTALRKMA